MLLYANPICESTIMWNTRGNQSTQEKVETGYVKILPILRAINDLIHQPLGYINPEALYNGIRSEDRRM